MKPCHGPHSRCMRIIVAQLIERVASDRLACGTVTVQVTMSEVQLHGCPTLNMPKDGIGDTGISRYRYQWVFASQVSNDEPCQPFLQGC